MMPVMVRLSIFLTVSLFFDKIGCGSAQPWLKSVFSPVFALTFRYFVQKYAFCRDCGSLQCEIFRITVNFWLVKSGEQRVLNRIKSVNLRR